MGYAYLYQCNRCNYEEYFKQGPGFMVHPQSFKEYIDGNQKLFHYKIHNKIVELEAKHPGLHIQSTFQVYKCPHCNRLFNKIQVSLFSGEQKLHVSKFRCSECMARLKLTNIHRLKKAVCPGCGKNTFRRNAQQELLWD